jgi:hypothetical protein
MKKILISICKYYLIGNYMGIQYNHNKKIKIRNMYNNIIYKMNFLHNPKRKIFIKTYSVNIEILLLCIKLLKNNKYNMLKNKNTIIKKYIKFFEKMLLENNDESNLSLLISFPLYLFINYEKPYLKDILLTNNNIINSECNRIYFYILKSLYDNTDILLNSSIEIIDNIIKNALNSVKNRRIIMKFDLMKSNWIVYSLFFIIYAAMVDLPPSQIYQDILELKIDPKSNGAICGSIIGLRFRNNIIFDKNLKNWENNFLN